jgi:acyl-CoA synthetase (NDP forming)
MTATVESLLAARSIALVGASPRPGSFGQRMVEEVTRSPSRPRVHLINPRYAEIDGRRCLPSLADVPDPADLVLLAVSDGQLEPQLELAAARGDRSAVIFGNAYEPASGDSPPLRDRLAAIARDAGMAMCGAGCMGFINVSRGLRAIGYIEASPLAAGPVALVTHSGSVFSALLRARRGLRFSLAVSSGQELVTTTPAYLEYALGLPETRVLALVLEAMRDAGQLTDVLATAAERDIPVVLLTVGGSASGQAMVAAHSGALAAADGVWEALARAYGVHRVADLAELTDTLELFAIGRRVIPPVLVPSQPPAQPGESPSAAGPVLGIATVHDSGLERAHTADVAEQLDVPFAEISPATTELLGKLLDPGLLPANPLDVWGTGADTRELFAASLTALAGDPSVAAVALAVDLVHELDGDRSYPLALLDATVRTDKPLAVLSNLSSAIDPEIAGLLRESGVPVLEGTRTGLLALRHLLDHARQTALAPQPGPASPAAAKAGLPRGGHARTIDPDRQRRARELLAAGVTGGAPLLALLRDYGIPTVATRPATDEAGTLAAAQALGYPVVLKTDEPEITHKSDVGGVVLGLDDPDALALAYADLAERLGRRVLVSQTAPAGPELALGLVRDPGLGPLIVIGAGGILVELLADRAVALPPVDEALAAELLAGLRVSKLLAGVRGAPPAALAPALQAITGLSALAAELGDDLEALDVNPLICGPEGAVAVDALAIPRHRP